MDPGRRTPRKGFAPNGAAQHHGHGEIGKHLPPPNTASRQPVRTGNSPARHGRRHPRSAMNPQTSNQEATPVRAQKRIKSQDSPEGLGLSWRSNTRQPPTPPCPIPTAHVHLGVQAILQHQAVGHGHPMGLHRVSLPIVVLSHIWFIKVRDLWGMGMAPGCAGWAGRGKVSAPGRHRLIPRP